MPTLPETIVFVLIKSNFDPTPLRRFELLWYIRFSDDSERAILPMLSLHSLFQNRMALNVTGCVHDSKYDCPRIFHPLINNAVDHLLVTFTFILLLLSALYYSREVH